MSCVIVFDSSLGVPILADKMHDISEGNLDW